MAYMKAALESIFPRIDTIKVLRALLVPLDVVYVTGYTTANDNAFGSNFFKWNPTSTAADNGGTIIKLTGTLTGRYELQYSGAVNVKWFGAVGNGIADDTVAIQNAINFSKKVYLPSGNYRLNTAITVLAQQEIFGDFPNSYDPVGAKDSTTVIGYGIDTIITNIGSAVRNMRVYAVGGNAIKMDGARQSLLENLTIRGGLLAGSKGIYTIDGKSWDCKINNCFLFKFDIAVSFFAGYGVFTNCSLMENNTGVDIGLGHFTFNGGFIAHNYVKDIYAGYTNTGDFYTDYNCQIFLNNVHLEANNSTTITRISFGNATNGQVTDRSCLIIKDCFVANNSSTGVWFDILSGSGSSITLASITGVDSTYTNSIVVIGANASRVYVSPFITYPFQIAVPVLFNNTVSKTVNRFDMYDVKSSVDTDITGATTAGTGTYGAKNLAYTIIGNLCFCDFIIDTVTHTGTGNLQILLPFPRASNGQNLPSVGSIFASNLTFTAGSVLSLVVGAGSNRALIRETINDASGGYVQVDSTAYIAGSICYPI